MLRVIFTLLLCVSLPACLSPSQKFQHSAESYGFYPKQIWGENFLHRLFLNKAVLNTPQKKILHVYLDGDGTPWKSNRWVSADPTSRNPIVLELINLDSSPSILLGRPCYHGLKNKFCEPKYWTSDRYSERVVNSLTTVLNKFLLENPYKKVVLIGYSGGGTLAALMARNIININTLVTIAANLDIEKWTHFHDYLPLTNSLNPINFPPLPASIKQIHFAGLKDENIPAEIIKNFSDKQVNAVFYPITDFNHHCCWVSHWHKLLTQVIY